MASNRPHVDAGYGLVSTSESDAGLITYFVHLVLWKHLRWWRITGLSWIYLQIGPICLSGGRTSISGGEGELFRVPDFPECLFLVFDPPRKLCNPILMNKNLFKDPSQIHFQAVSSSEGKCFSYGQKALPPPPIIQDTRDLWVIFMRIWMDCVDF